MTKTKDNTKKKRTTQKKGKVVGFIGVPSNTEVSQLVEKEEIERRAFWSEAINELEQTQFASLEEAFYALVDHVMSRLQIRDDKETREFLYDLLNMDPEFRTEIKGLLNIRE
ncbi:MAG: hypothetical protein KDD55_06260 [Bdellovibrionales bacterium]|nr:hypothetical protein [Bdellovibrionales bacterium]